MPKSIYVRQIFSFFSVCIADKVQRRLSVCDSISIKNVKSPSLQVARWLRLDSIEVVVAEGLFIRVTCVPRDE